MKKKVKKQREIINEGKDASVLTAAEVKKFQASLERIGTRKARGFIFMAEINKNAKSNDDSIDAFGLVFFAKDVNRVKSAVEEGLDVQREPITRQPI